MLKLTANVVISADRLALTLALDANLRHALNGAMLAYCVRHNISTVDDSDCLPTMCELILAGTPYKQIDASETGDKTSRPIIGIWDAQHDEVTERWRWAGHAIYPSMQSELLQTGVCTLEGLPADLLYWDDASAPDATWLATLVLRDADTDLSYSVAITQDVAGTGIYVRFKNGPLVFVGVHAGQVCVDAGSAAMDMYERFNMSLGMATLPS